MNIYKILENNLPLISKHRFLLGVSGGVDSMVLLHGMISLKKNYDFDIKVLHVNHGVRGEEAKRDQRLVEDYCSRSGIEFFLKEADMNSFAKKHKLSKEEAGRELRRRFFFEIKKECKADFIVLAHQADDQVETVLFRILRGTGVKGLCGMKIRSGDILRPLLSVRRREIEEYAKAFKVPYAEDSTNSSDIYSRNKIRNKLIPFIENNFEFDFFSSIERLSDNSSELWEAAASALDLKYPEAVNKGEIVVSSFLSNSVSIRLLILHREFEKFSLGREALIRISDWIEKGRSGSEIDLSLGVKLERSFDRVRIKKDKTEDLPLTEFVIGKDIVIPNAGLISSSFAKVFEVCNASKDTIFVDGDKLCEPIVIRSKRNSDKIAPYGMGGEKKLKDIFREEKIPVNLRNKVPVIESGGQIVWVAGIRDSRIFKIDETTKNILKIEFRKTGGKNGQ